MQMASAFLKTVESRPIVATNVPAKYLVTFRFYLGKLYMQQELYAKAEDALDWAFMNCKLDPRKSALKRGIFECLVAVRLRLGKLPPPSLLRIYGVSYYDDIIDAMRKGNIATFDAALKSHQRKFISEGTLLCLENLKFTVYRTLVRRAKVWATKNLDTDGNVLPISLFTAAFKWQIDESLVAFDDEEMACILATLIKMEYLKGYIAWEHRKIVFSKLEPLPSLQRVLRSM
eukprot:Polyplicarium_translucidae@DN3323_c0_g1_i10.p1